MAKMFFIDTLRWLFFPEQCRHCTDPPCILLCSRFLDEGV